MQTLEHFSTPKEKLIVALDNIESISDVNAIVRATQNYVEWYKVGLETITYLSAQRMIRLIKTLGKKVFNDGKYHDIPNTVGNTVSKVSQFYPDMINMHCCNGVKAMKKAVAQKGEGILLLGVTVLTCHSEEECQHIFGGTIAETVLKFARDAQEAGMDGIVCAGRDLEILAPWHELDSMLKVTPGIQNASMAQNDQNKDRVVTAGEAIRLGATAVVAGRVITENPDPGRAAQIMVQEIAEAMMVKD